MPQLHLYLPKDLADEIAERARDRGTSVSRVLVEIVTRELSRGWPEGFFQEIVGGWAGEPLHRPPQPPIEERDHL